MKKIYLTEKQLSFILKEECGGATTTTSVGSETTRGDIGYDSPRAISIKTKNGKKDPSVTEDGRSPENDLKSLFGK